MLQEWKGPVVTANPEVFNKIASADAQRFSKASDSSPEAERQINDQMKKILDKAKKLAEESKSGETAGQGPNQEQVRRSCRSDFISNLLVKLVSNVLDGTNFFHHHVSGSRIRPALAPPKHLSKSQTSDKCSVW